MIALLERANRDNIYIDASDVTVDSTTSKAVNPLSEDYDGTYDSEDQIQKPRVSSKLHSSNSYNKTPNVKRAKITLGDAMRSFYKRGYKME